MRGSDFGLVLLAVGSLTSCAGADGLTGPANTDVGLRVWAEVSPATVSVRDTAAVLRIRVHVENPTRREIRVVSGGPPYRFTGDPGQSRGLWGSVRIASDTSALNGGPNTDWWGDSVYVFRPRRGVYDEATVSLREWRAGGWPLAPGRYRVRGWFNGREGQGADLVLTP